MAYANKAGLDSLLSDLCIRLGFCDPGRDPGRFEALIPLGIEAFTDAVLEEDGSSERVRNQVRDCVAKHFTAWGTNGAA